MRECLYVLYSICIGVCVYAHYLYLLLCPAIDPCSVSSALFDNDAAACSGLSCHDVSTDASAGCLHHTH